MKKWSSYWGELFISLILYNIQYLTVSKDVNENYSTIIEKKSQFTSLTVNVSEFCYVLCPSSTISIT